MTSHHEFLSLDPEPFGAVDESGTSPIQSHLDTLFAEFTRNRPRTSPPRDPTVPRLRRADARTLPRKKREEEDVSQIDLRALDYTSNYDTHLMCPICHVPFVKPLVLDCDHTFCTACFEEYREGADHSQRSQCPTCRAYLLGDPHKASRLIVNMCNDIQVRCPNEDCHENVPRGLVEQHATRDCPEWRLPCPDTECGKLVKRKNYVPSQCIHNSHIECDCGAIIELGRGEWLKHKDEDCPTTGVKCDLCNERISVRDYLAGRNAHVCKDDVPQTCPGAEFGCTDDLTTTDLQTHTTSCPLARLAPHLKKQNQLLSSLTDQLTLTKVRNEVLETSLDRLTTLVSERMPSGSRTTSPTPSRDNDNDIEEIPRHATSPSLTLPAHLRPLTPSPTPMHPNDLMTLHANLEASISHLSTQLTNLQAVVSELDARSSMTMMNETLRLKEEQAHQAAGLFSTRSQVQWLLNRERQRVMTGETLRGRVSQQGQPSVGNPSHGLQQSHVQQSGVDHVVAGNISSRSSDAGAAGEDVSLTAGIGLEQRSPIIAATSPRVRPVLRRLSGSQERVKL